MIDPRHEAIREIIEIVLDLPEEKALDIMRRAAELWKQKESASLFKTESISEHPQQSTL